MREDRRSARWLALGGVVVAGFAIMLAVASGRSSAVVVPTVPPAPRDARVNEPSIAGPLAATVRDAHPFDAGVERPVGLVELEESGEGSEAWNAQGTALLDAFGATALEMTERGCFVAGCGALYRFSSADEYQRQLAKLVASELYVAWTGGKVFSPVQLRADHQVVVSFLLYRPD